MPEGLTLTGYSRSQGRFPTRETRPPRHDPSRTWVSLLLSPLEARERTERNRKEGEGRKGKEGKGRKEKGMFVLQSTYQPEVLAPTDTHPD